MVSSRLACQSTALTQRVDWVAWASIQSYDARNAIDDALHNLTTAHGSKVTRVIMFVRRGGRPRLIIHEYAVTFSGRGFGRVAEVVETQVLEARLVCEGRLWMNHREKHEVWTLLD